MKKFYCIILSLFLCASVFAGCGTSLGGDESTVYIDKKGAVTYLDIAPFGQDYYDEEELQKEINESIEAYNEEHGKNTVTIQDITIDEQTARLQTKYKSAEDFSNMIRFEMYQGKVVAALADGYSFEGDFLKVTDGDVEGSVKKEEFYGESSLNVVIMKANINVKVDGEICYVSEQNVEVTGKDSVSIRDGGDAVETDVYTYIIYK